MLEVGLGVERLSTSGGPSMVDASCLAMHALAFGPSAQGDRWCVELVPYYFACSGARP